jgi:hypothetical protein
MREQPSMAIYRVYFRNQYKFVVGRDDFEAGDDVHAIAIARAVTRTHFSSALKAMMLPSAMSSR